jgi:hypothetical protein
VAQPNPSTNKATILAISASTGGALWQWDFPAGHTGVLVAPQAGGGVVVSDITVDVNSQAVQQNVVRLDGNGIPTYDTWSTGGGALGYYKNGIWVNGPSPFTSNPQPSGAVAAAAITVADTDWVNPAGNERKQARPPKRTKFQENTTCSAVDDTIDPPWIMVPMSGSNNGAKVNIRGNTQDVQFVSEDTTIATVTRAAPTGGNTTITVSGLKSGQITTIDARSISDPSHNYSQLKVVVKPQLLKFVDMYKIIESVDNLTPQSMPTAGDLQAYLNTNATAQNTWGKQANVSFTVNPLVGMGLSLACLGKTAFSGVYPC